MLLLHELSKAFQSPEPPLFAKCELIAVVTAYDYPSVVHLDTSRIDIPGRRLASMVVHGHDTLSLSHSTKSSSIAVQSLAAPCGHYSLVTCHLEPMRPASVRVLNMDAIKLEGGFPSRISTVKVIVEARIAVIGHVGLTPQPISVLGGFRQQGKNVASAVKRLQWLCRKPMFFGCYGMCSGSRGCCSHVSSSNSTIGIGAGPFAVYMLILFYRYLHALAGSIKGQVVEMGLKKHITQL
ncbi:hypothetical protein F3Y22_tig00111278pilonHSYRG00086 [Hibiscus syriacus]|uniref:3-methyl-2-oxobutanoate hydroxymethyltransferase n=1 Tax=Hibiscus syriacus TaxID=106335 RepID=A0A6A2YRL5_HIBSY|nr:hypothetical protein F3Y22_tig00111278pilonHSYRG00086 [Hibiscus syriacus]